jgi:hypothetical protein
MIIMKSSVGIYKAGWPTAWRRRQIRHGSAKRSQSPTCLALAHFNQRLPDKRASFFDPGRFPEILD